MVSEDNHNSSNLNILVLEPYFGGSHKSFLEGMRCLPFNFEFMTLPPRNWKWRMRLAAPFFARKLHESAQQYDRIICSSYVDVASFRGLAPRWVRDVPLLTYFHENQFAYPVHSDDPRDVHFALTNVTTAFSSDSVAFNSKYNLVSMLDGTQGLMRHSTDLKLNDARSAIQNKSIVLFPGIDFSVIDASNAHDRSDTPVILWNQRWEHDKNPDLFFHTLFKLDNEGVDFKLAVVGESFESRPPIFDEAKQKLAHRILHFGYVDSIQDYAYWLKKSDIVVSTALHEFFGIAVIEAVRAGCRPLLPKRLSYPELFPDEFLYAEEEFLLRLRDNILNKKRLPLSQPLELTRPYTWDTLGPAYLSWIIDE
jgi:glycosyltransferase involved in cell wall biosynthesis